MRPFFTFCGHIQTIPSVPHCIVHTSFFAYLHTICRLEYLVKFSRFCSQLSTYFPCLSLSLSLSLTFSFIFSFFSLHFHHANKSPFYAFKRSGIYTSSILIKYTSTELLGCLKRAMVKYTSEAKSAERTSDGGWRAIKKWRSE